MIGLVLILFAGLLLLRPGEREILSRAIRSEAEGQTRAERIAVAWAVVNQAKRKGWQSLFPWGPQGLNGRWAATTKKARPIDYEIADLVLSGQVPDPTGGARSFFEPAAQDRLYGTDPRYRYDAAGIRAKWTAEGMRLVATVGRWEFWR